MTIEIERCSDHYRADCKDLPGSPPVGIGYTKEMAVASLFWLLIFDSETNWIGYIKRDEPIIVDGAKFKYPKSYGNCR